MVTETELLKLPPFGVNVGVATGFAVVGAVTFRLKEVVFVVPPLVPETVIGYVPVAVELPVVIFNPREQLSVQVVAENETEAPDGNPASVKLTG